MHQADARDREAVTAIRDWMAHAGANDDRRAWGGSPAGGMDALLGRGTLAGLAADDNGATASAGRLEAELGYGIALFGGGFTGTPNLGIGLSDTGRDYRLGWRLTSARRGGPSFEIGLEATRREAANADAEHGVMLRGTVRWQGSAIGRGRRCACGSRPATFRPGARHHVVAQLVAVADHRQVHREVLEWVVAGVRHQAVDAVGAVRRGPPRPQEPSLISRNTQCSPSGFTPESAANDRVAELPAVWCSWPPRPRLCPAPWPNG